MYYKQIQFTFLGLLFLCFLACNPSRTSTTYSPDKGIDVSLRLMTSSPLNIQLGITNQVYQAVELNLYTLQIPSLSLELKDAWGNLIPPLPPPIPSEEMNKHTKVLSQGETLVINYNSLGVSQNTKTERLHARFKGDAIVSITDETTKKISFASEWTMLSF